MNEKFVSLVIAQVIFLLLIIWGGGQLVNYGVSGLYFLAYIIVVGVPFVIASISVWVNPKYD